MATGYQRHLDRVLMDTMSRQRQRRADEAAKQRVRDRVMKQVGAETPEQLAEMIGDKASSLAVKRVSDLLDDIEGQKAIAVGPGYHADGDDMSEVIDKVDRGFLGKKNMYTCGDCGNFIVTVDVDKGTTPFMTMCTADGCSAMMQSSFYRINQDLNPSHEWYLETDVEGLSEAVKQHVAMGGLLLRPIDKN